MGQRVNLQRHLDLPPWSCVRRSSIPFKEARAVLGSYR